MLVVLGWLVFIAAVVAIVLCADSYLNGDSWKE